MRKIKFNQDWVVSDSSSKTVNSLLSNKTQSGKTITLPYDCMIHEKRTKNTKHGSQTGFYPGGNYQYIRQFSAPEEWKNSTVLLEFEGIYGTAKVFVNNVLAYVSFEGYTPFTIGLNDHLNYGADNQIRVEVLNDEEQNTRWYSGSGIYRSVNLYVGTGSFIAQHGIRLHSEDVSKDGAVICLDTELVNRSEKKACTLYTEIISADGSLVNKDVCPVTLFADDTELIHRRIFLKEPKLWSPDAPNLYTVHCKLMEGEILLDEQEEVFGVRSLAADPVRGFRINGQKIELKGACIHHDSGLIGANTYQAAEDRKIRLMKEAGFNTIRSAHNLVSEETLSACDRYGMLVIDELSDMWNTAKNTKDYSMHFSSSYETLVRAMIRKDFNHPSVIAYSTSNEVPEAGTAYGARLNRKITNLIRDLDPGRFTTAGLNALIALGPKIGVIIKDVQQSFQKQNAGNTAADAGSNALNGMMSIMHGPLADLFARHELVSETLCEFAETLDIVGYNYLTGRHESEKEKYPNRVIMGSETYAQDIPVLWNIVKRNPHVIGDMTWTGWDYLGEAGIGGFYYDGGRPFSNHWPDRISFCGDFDLLGNRKAISYYRQAAYGELKEPRIFCERMDRNGTAPSVTTWAWKDIIPSWTWKGYEGKTIKVWVLSDAEETELFLNGLSFGRKKVGETEAFLSVYELPYESGTLTAVDYVNGEKRASYELSSAGDDVSPILRADKTDLQSNCADLAFVEIALNDGNGLLNMQQSRRFKVEINGPAELIGLGNACFSSEEEYDSSESVTWDGRAMAVIRSENKTGQVQVRCRTEDGKEAEITLVIH